MLSDQQVINLAKQEEKLHPKASLIDYYKLFFQGTFGPGHFIESEKTARNFLREELASAKSFETHLYQKIDYHTTFYRVNLVVINIKLVGLEDFFNGFLRSSKFKATISRNEWAAEWQQIESILKKSSLKISDFEEASRHLRLLIQQEKYLVSHSQIYHQNYQPHYRLFSEKEFLKLSLD